MEYRLWRKYCKKYIALVKLSHNESGELMEKHHIFPQSIQRLCVYAKSCKVWQDDDGKGA